MVVGDAHVFLGFLTPVVTQLFFPKPLLSSLASAEVRGENSPERKIASTGGRTHNHQVMSPTRSPLSHPGGAQNLRLVQIETNNKINSSQTRNFVLGKIENKVGQGNNAAYQHFLLFPQCF